MDGSAGGVGMTNTDLRLKNYYGPQSSLKVQSNEYGYSVAFSIPIAESMEKIAEVPATQHENQLV